MDTPTALPVGVPLYIYGAGRGGHILKHALDGRSGARVAAFLDSHKTGTVGGLPILNPAQVATPLAEGAVVVIASQHWREIAGSLDRSRFPRVINAYPWIEGVLAAEERARTQGPRRIRRLRMALLATAVLLQGAVAYGIVRALG
ncbi:hypothetical protein [Azospirillum rugosum]|uniref:FlaA1/EpsC-like NDP-sugar epimerase n=1 Tax=Azospirillum rugosum TaxID=416170 RepID=A0ABS4SP96_9PROT|nr:hypothetical protein [Azospirillum rugosum]MBP2294312.1 FlaA1/EpsC-like NDP-sugar epimerase [Azospirillum rugosum]MDQ0527647.1 FlaA1/EpsC-like NDP-sugar epimerase [Azospirillum rugosum]